MSISATSSAWNAAEIARRGLNSAIAHSSSACGSSPSYWTDSSPASSSSKQLVRAHAAASSRTRFFAGSRPASDTELVVRQPALEVGEGLAVGAACEPAAHEPLDGGLDLLARDAAEERAADLRHGTERAAHEDVVGGDAIALGVLAGRRLEAEVADPVLRARVRAAVEMQAAAPRSRRRTCARGGRQQSRRRSFVSPTEKLQCGSPVQAIEFAQISFVVSGRPSSSSFASVVVVRRKRR